MRKKIRKLFHADDLKFVKTALRYAEALRRHKSDGQTKAGFQKCRWFTDRLDPIWDRAEELRDAIPHDKDLSKLYKDIEFAYRVFIVYMLDYRAGQTWQYGW